MDIHKPKPIHSLREFAKEIATVTVGILIALGLEALIEADHHHHTAEQARATFRTELTENRSRIERDLTSIHAHNANFQQTIAYLQARLEHKSATAPQNMELDTYYVSLQSAAWDTAQATQAFSFMTPGETHALATVHSEQNTFETLEPQALHAGIGLTGLIGDPGAYDDEQMRNAFALISTNYAYVSSIAKLETIMLRDIDTAQKALKD